MSRAAIDRNMSIMHVDVTSTYFYTDASRDIYGERQAGDQQEGDEYRCGRLNKAMCGTRDAAQIWQRKCVDAARSLGFHVGTVPPCPFYREGKKVCGLVHGDDFVFVGRKEYPAEIADYMAGQYKIKTAFTGPGGHNLLRVLSRSIMWADEGVIYESDHRHADRLIEELGLTPKQTVITAAIRESRKACKRKQVDKQNDQSFEESGGREGNNPLTSTGHIGASQGARE